MERRLATCLALAAVLAASGCGGGAAAPAATGGQIAGIPHRSSKLDVRAVSATLVALDWSGADASGGAYHIYRDGKLDKSAKLTAGGAVDSGLQPGTQYCYQLSTAGAADTADSNQSCTTTPSLAAWEMQTVGLRPTLSMALSPQGRERLGYCSPGGVAYLEHQAGGDWSTTLVDADAACSYAALAVDRVGATHMIYLDQNTDTLRYATDASGSWLVDEIPGATGAEFYVLAVDGAGHAHVAYQVFTGHAPDCFQIIYATDASGSWQSTMVAGGDVYPAIAADAAGRAYIAFLGAQAPDGSYPVHYLSDASGTWTDAVVAASGDPKSLVALAVDDAGHGHLAYKSHTDLYHASDLSGAWQSARVESFSATDPELDRYGAYDVSIALDASGAAHISYEDTSGDLKYASPAGAGWDTLYLDTVGAQNQLCMDSSGHAHILYAGMDNLYSRLAVSP